MIHRSFFDFFAFCLGLATSCLASGASKAHEHIVGQEYIGSIPFLKTVRLGQILRSTDPKNADYGVNWGEDADGKSLVFFNKLMGYEGKYPKWKVIDVFALPSVKSTEVITNFCHADSEKWESIQARLPQEFILAIATFSQGQEKTKGLRAAWKINWKKLEFEQIQTKGISCFMEVSDE